MIKFLHFGLSFRLNNSIASYNGTYLAQKSFLWN